MRTGRRLAIALLAGVLGGAASAQQAIDGLVSVTRSGLVYNRANNSFDVTVSVTNVSKAALQAPLAVMATNISASGVRLKGVDGRTAQGVPFVAAGLDRTGLPAGQSIRNVVLQFENPSRVAFTFRVSVANQLNASQVQLATASSDMRGPHEAFPRGVPSNDLLFFNWYSKPRINLQSAPAAWKSPAIGPWGMAYVPVHGNPATNTRLEIKDLQLWGLCRSGGERGWKLVQSYPRVGGMLYRADFSGDASDAIPADLRNERDGGVSVRLVEGRNFHFFGPGRRAFSPNGMPMLARFRARLVKDDPAGPDDRSIARIIASPGGDYWKDQTIPWAGDYVNNRDFAIGKFKYVRSQYRTYYAHNLSQSDLLVNRPPPLLPVPEWSPDPQGLTWTREPVENSPVPGEFEDSVLTGDFDGDGADDAFYYDHRNFRMWVGRFGGIDRMAWASGTRISPMGPTCVLACGWAISMATAAATCSSWLTAAITISASLDPPRRLAATTSTGPRRKPPWIARWRATCGWATSTATAAATSSSTSRRPADTGWGFQTARRN